MTFSQMLPIDLLIAPLLPVARAILPLLMPPFELWPTTFLAASVRQVSKKTIHHSYIGAGSSTDVCVVEDLDSGNRRNLSNVQTLGHQFLEEIPNWLLKVSPP